MFFSLKNLENALVRAYICLFIGIFAVCYKEIDIK